MIKDKPATHPALASRRSTALAVILRQEPDERSRRALIPACGRLEPFSILGVSLHAGRLHAYRVAVLPGRKMEGRPLIAWS